MQDPAGNRPGLNFALTVELPLVYSPSYQFGTDVYFLLALRDRTVSPNGFGSSFQSHLSALLQRMLLGSAFRRTAMFLVIAALALFMVSPSIYQTATLALVLAASAFIWLASAREAKLSQRIASLEADLLAARSVKEQVEQTRLQFIEYSDHVLRRVGAELHDGPAQLIGISLLRLDAGHADTAAARQRSQETGEKIDNSNLEATRQALTDALADIRNLSQGLILPEIDKLTLEQAARLAVAKHEQRTGTSVELTVSGLPAAAPSWMKRFVYRFASEGLMNAYRHAGGLGQAVEVNGAGGELELKVSDRGPGIATKLGQETTGRASLGLAGLRERAGAIGAVIDIQSAPGAGTCVKTRIPLSTPRELLGVPEV